MHATLAAWKSAVDPELAASVLGIWPPDSPPSVPQMELASLAKSLGNMHDIGPHYMAKRTTKAEGVDVPAGAGDLELEQYQAQARKPSGGSGKGAALGMLGDACAHMDADAAAMRDVRLVGLAMASDEGEDQEAPAHARSVKVEPGFQQAWSGAGGDANTASGSEDTGLQAAYLQLDFPAAQGRQAQAVSGQQGPGKVPHGKAMSPSRCEDASIRTGPIIQQQQQATPVLPPDLFTLQPMGTKGFGPQASDASGASDAAEQVLGRDLSTSTGDAPVVQHSKAAAFGMQAQEQQLQQTQPQQIVSLGLVEGMTGGSNDLLQQLLIQQQVAQQQQLKVAELQLLLQQQQTVQLQQQALLNVLLPGACAQGLQVASMPAHQLCPPGASPAMGSGFSVLATDNCSSFDVRASEGMAYTLHGQAGTATGNALAQPHALFTALPQLQPLPQPQPMAAHASLPNGASWSLTNTGAMQAGLPMLAFPGATGCWGAMTTCVTMGGELESGRAPMLGVEHPPKPCMPSSGPLQLGLFGQRKGMVGGVLFL